MDAGIEERIVEDFGPIIQRQKQKEVLAHSTKRTCTTNKLWGEGQTNPTKEL